MKSMRRWTLLGFVMLLLSACGGSSDDGDRMDETAYQAWFTQDGVDGTMNSDKVTLLTSETDITSSYWQDTAQEFIDGARARAEDVNGVSPPTRLEDDHDAWLDAAECDVKVASDLEDVASNHDDDEFAATYGQHLGCRLDFQLAQDVINAKLQSGPAEMVEAAYASAITEQRTTSDDAWDNLTVLVANGEQAWTDTAWRDNAFSAALRLGQAYAQGGALVPPSSQEDEHDDAVDVLRCRAEASRDMSKAVFAEAYTTWWQEHADEFAGRCD